MAALVADYGSSGEDSNDDTDVETNHTEIDKQNTEPKKNTNFFEDVEDSSSSENEEENRSSDKGNNSDSLPNPLAEKLPTPGLNAVEKSGSVFSNPFEIAEKAKNSILEKHVKMTETKTELTGKKAKKNICYKFKKGKCHFGKNCKYSHDIESDIVPKSTDNNETVTSSNQGSTSVSNSYFGLNFGQPLPAEPDDESYMSNIKKKKRSGLSEHLIPPKKAMHALDAQRAKERPWTVNKH